jgi:hypothetical protein
MSETGKECVTMLDFRTARVNFPAKTGQPQPVTTTVVFPTNVRAANVAVNGFDVGYVGSDHHLLRTQIDTSSSINLNTVNVVTNLSLRDSSGNFDDSYSGFVDVLVIADRA